MNWWNRTFQNTATTVNLPGGLALSERDAAFEVEFAALKSLIECAIIFNGRGQHNAAVAAVELAKKNLDNIQALADKMAAETAHHRN